MYVYIYINKHMCVLCLYVFSCICISTFACNTTLCTNSLKIISQPNNIWKFNTLNFSKISCKISCLNLNLFPHYALNRKKSYSSIQQSSRLDPKFGKPISLKFG